MDIAYSGYNKQLELYIIILFIFCDFILLPLLLLRRKEIKNVCISILKNIHSFFHFSHKNILFFFHAPIFKIKSQIFGIILLGFLYLLFQTSKITSAQDAIALYSVICTYLFLVAILRFNPKLFIHCCMAGIGCYFSLMGILIALKSDSTIFVWARLWSIPAACIAALGIAFWLRTNKLPTPTQVVALVWTLSPCLLFALTRYSYYIEGGMPVELYPSWFSGTCFNSIVVIILFFSLLTFFLRKYSMLFILCALSVALYISWSAPSPYFPTDFFHPGEMTTPLQQWLQFGKRPFLDYHPVHGMCDYYYFALSHLFFDGSYASFNAGMAVGKSLQAVLQILVLIIVCPNRYASLLLSILMPDLGTRWLAVGLCLPLSLWLSQRSDAIWFFVWSGFSGLCCILWNTPQGAAYCAALIPFIALKFWLQRKTPIRPRITQMAGVGILCIIVMALWPYLESLASSTLLTSHLAVETHGLPVLYGIRSAHWQDTLRALLFLPFLAFLYLQSFTSHEKKYFTTYLPFSLSLFCLVCANYAFLRYTAGWKAQLMSLVVIVASVTAMRCPRTFFRVGGYAFLAATLLLNSPSIFPSAYQRMYSNQVFTCKKDFVLPSDTVLKYIGNLGRGFIKPSILKELQEFRAYLDKNGNDYAGYDSNLVRYCIFNSENHFKYQTWYNIEGMKKQNDTLMRIKTDRVNTIVMNLHGYILYYLQVNLLDMGFYPDAILNNTYLILRREQNNLIKETPATTVLLNTPLIFPLKHLPQVWEPACASLTESTPLPYELTLKNCIRTETGSLLSENGGSVEILLHFKEPVSARIFQFLLLSAQTGGRNHQVIVTSPDIAGGKNGYSFWLGKRTSALPLFRNYAWLFFPSLKEIHLEIKDVHPGKDFNLDISFRRFLSE